MVATNGQGWVVEEFILPVGWQVCQIHPYIYLTKAQAVREMKRAQKNTKNELRAYEALE